MKLVLDKVDLMPMSGKDHWQVLMSHLAEFPLRLVVPGKSDLCFVAAFGRLD